VPLSNLSFVLILIVRCEDFRGFKITHELPPIDGLRVIPDALIRHGG
jgi:hypothetical protein